MFRSRHDSTAIARVGGPASSAASVRGASLHYVSDGGAGMSRRRAGRRFVYFDPAGRRVRDPEVIARVTALAIPPAYTNVWICLDPDGHIQATARDARGRKQYRYHPRWRAVRDATKFERMLAFGKALPRIRKQVEADLARPGMPREKVLATVVRLLETTLMRVGNDEYVKRNRSYGLTTLENRHVNLSGNGVRFEFRGKSGIVHRVTVQEPRIARIIRRCLDMPGHDLFSYLDEEGAPHPIRSTDVNAYLQAAAGADFTAKDYRTWAASVLAMSRLAHLPREPQRAARSTIVTVMKAVAERLGNTAAICRKSYVHPGGVRGLPRGHAEERRAAQRERHGSGGDAVSQVPPEQGLDYRASHPGLVARAETAIIGVRDLTGRTSHARRCREAVHRHHRANFNYIVDTGVPPVRYIDWPEMEHKAVPPQYRQYEMTVSNGRPLRDTFKLDVHGFVFADARDAGQGFHRRGGARSAFTTRRCRRSSGSIPAPRTSWCSTTPCA